MFKGIGASIMEERNNNFDLVRLFAAVQVAIVHIVHHLNLSRSMFVDVIGLFPGVPIFFFVSGFLVSRSLELNSDTRRYFRNRLLRIYPGLWWCFSVTLLAVLLIYTVPWTSRGFWFWILGQLTFFQFYNPEFLRGYGVGVLNGSLWTISVEMQYYLLLPILYWIAGARKLQLFVPITVIALLVNVFYLSFIYGTDTLPAKLLQVSIVPWLGLFLSGVVAQQLWPQVRHFVAGKFVIWLVVYLICSAIFKYAGLRNSGNGINTFLAIILFACVLSAAFTLPKASERILKGNDVSYGIYLYHMPVLNAYLALGGLASWGALGLLLGISAACAVLSWVVIEKPVLMMKHGKK